MNKSRNRYILEVGIERFEKICFSKLLNWEENPGGIHIKGVFELQTLNSGSEYCYSDNMFSSIPNKRVGAKRIVVFPIV